MIPKLEWLEEPEIFRVNRLDAHSDHHFYETEEDCKEGRETLRQSLNGTWKFAWSRCPKERPSDFFRESEALDAFGTIQVPGHIELQGYGGIHYINTMYPWDGHTYLRPPHVDWEDNPVGSYVKEFDLSPDLAGKRICISFQGVEQAMYVWLNGAFIGYAEDTFTPSEFELTEHIRAKGNRLCVEVYKRSCAAWIEDQDFFRFSGIFREVYLYAKPKIHIENFWAKCGLGEDCRTGTLEIEAELSGAESSSVAWTLEDAQGTVVGSGRLEGCGQDDSGEKNTVLYKSEKLDFPDIRPWNAGAPYLYQLYLRVLDQEGQIAEVVPYRVGFRRFEIKNKLMLLNGRRLIIHGVNRHEWNPRRGRAITEEDMRQDIEILKKNHINAVRTCHYPDQSLWYQLCDEAGICIMDETNLESHGSWQKLGQIDPSWNVPGSEARWEACVVDRAVSMLERDKNHPCILWWSCGNESYAGTCIQAMSRYFHEKDPSRLVHYEGVFWNREFDSISDVESRMYAAPADIRSYLEKEPQKPFLLCEYMHDMGNSLGGMESYIRLLEEFPMYQGGFIWDYIDQAVYYKNDSGEEVLGYGGDFGDRPTDYAFSGNGILFADRTEKPAAQEVRYWYAAPQERSAMDAENARLRGQAEMRLAEAYNAEAQDEVPEQGPSDTDGFRVIHGDVNLGIKGRGFAFLFSYGEGGPVSIVYDGKECLYRSPRPAFWRATTENDRGNGFHKKSGMWLAADLFAFCRGCSVTEYAPGRTETLVPAAMADRSPAAEDIEKITITYVYAAGTMPDTEVSIAYTVDRKGRIHTEVHYFGKKGLPELPLFGLRFVMPGPIETVEWEGLSGETYPDRMAGGYFGLHKSSVKVPGYLVPQECGNHMDTCQAAIGPLRIVMDKKPFHFSALPYTPEELENALHVEELPKSSRTVVTILAEMRGVGGIDSWGSDVEPAYRVSGERDICYSFYIDRR